MAGNLLVLSLALLCTRMSSAFVMDGDSSNTLASLLSLITEEKRLRASLESEIHTLKTNIAALKTKHRASLCNCPNNGPVAFSATLTSDITNLGYKQPIVFNKVITNVGNGYDARHGMFRAPVTGSYKFSASILQGTASMWISLEIVKDGAVIGRIKTGDNGYWTMGSNIITTHLNAGDDVWVRHTNDEGSKKIMSDSGYFTTFTGHLISAD